MNRNEKQVFLQVLLGSLLCVFLAGLFYALTFWRPSVLGLGALSRASSTRIALALTSQSLYGPFPTPTGPTPTPSRTPTDTFTPTVTPSVTPTETSVRYFIDTATPRTPIANQGTIPLPGSTSVPAPTHPPIQATSVPVQPTSPPAQPTSPPQPTSRPQPTSAPAQPTKKACLNPQGHPIPCH